MSCMPFNCGTKARERAGAQTSHPYETVGRTTASQRRLIMGEDLSHIKALTSAVIAPTTRFCEASLRTCSSDPPSLLLSVGELHCCSFGQ